MTTILSAKFENRLSRIFDIAEYIDPQFMVTEVFKDGSATIWHDGTGYVVTKGALFTNYAKSRDEDIRDWTPTILAQEPGIYVGTVLTMSGFGFSAVSELFLDRVKLKRAWREDIE